MTCLWVSGSGIRRVSGWVVLGCDLVSLDECLWDMTCLWVSGSGIRRVSGWVVLGFDAVSLGEWFWDVTLCLWVSVYGIWRVSVWVVLGYDAVSGSKWLWDMTLCFWVIDYILGSGPHGPDAPRPFNRPFVRLWVSGCGLWRCLSGWEVVWCDAVSVGKWLLDMTLCLWVSGFQRLEWTECLLLEFKVVPQESWEPVTLLATHLRRPESSETILWGKSRLPALVCRKQWFIFTANFWFVTSCILADIYRRLGRKHGRYLPGW